MVHSSHFRFADSRHGSSYQPHVRGLPRSTTGSLATKRSNKEWQWEDAQRHAAREARGDAVDETRMGLSRHRAFVLESRKTWAAFRVGVQ